MIKTILYLLLFTLSANISAYAQDEIKTFIDSCKTKIDEKLSVYTADKGYDIRFNKSRSDIRFLKKTGLRDEAILIYVSLADYDNYVMPTEYYNFGYRLFYDIIYDDLAIHSMAFLDCDESANENLKFIEPILIKLKENKLIHPEKALSIAKDKNFASIIFFEIDEDQGWEPGHYEEDEKKWKITYTIKQKNTTKTFNESWYEVIKVDATDGKILSQYFEHPID